MGWFNSRSPAAEELDARKHANRRAVVESVAATDKLNRVFENNGFTVKIAVAMGAKEQKGATQYNGH